MDMTEPAVVSLQMSEYVGSELERLDRTRRELFRDVPRFVSALLLSYYSLTQNRMQRGAGNVSSNRVVSLRSHPSAISLERRILQRGCSV